MNILEKVSDFFGKRMSVIVLVVAAFALFVPSSCLWIQLYWVNYLLMVVMFGMGLTLRLDDFKLVFMRPKDIIIGYLSQFIIMPLLDFQRFLIWMPHLWRGLCLWELVPAEHEQPPFFLTNIGFIL